MKFNVLAVLLTSLLVSGLVSATDGYTEVYEADDIVEAAIDLGASITGGLAGEGVTIGGILGSLIVIGMVIALIGGLIMLLKKLVGIAKVAK